MSRNAKHKKVARARRTAWTAALVGLLLCPILWPLSPSVQSAADESQAVWGQGEPLRSEGFIFMPKGVVAPGWARDKSVRVKFMLKREDGQRFAEGVIGGVKAELNGEEVPVSPKELKPNRDPIKVLFMIDRSGSMEIGGNGVKKLEAAKRALHYFVDGLDPNDEAAIYGFNLEQTPYAPLTSKKEDLKEGIERIEAVGNTSLYGSMESALDTAAANGVQHVIFLSDGKEDTPGSRQAVRENRLPQFKSENEENLSQKARRYGIPVSTVAMGDPADGGDGGVDEATLERISKVSNGGIHRLINIPLLNEEARGDSTTLNNKLIGKLKDVLAEIKKHIQFDYEQPVALPGLQAGEGSFRYTVTVDKDGTGVPFTVEYDVTLESGGTPIFSLRRFGRLGLINTKPPIGWTGLAQIYLLLFVPLLVLILLPAALKGVANVRAAMRMRHAIEVIERGTPLHGKQCPNEMGAAGQRYLFKEGDVALVCPKCHTPHHLSCWEYNQHRCMNRVCEYQSPVPSRLLDKYKMTPPTRKRFV